MRALFLVALAATMCGDQPDTAPDIPVTPVRLAAKGVVRSVVASPDTMHLNPGDVGQAVCTVYGNQNTVLKYACSWKSLDTAIAKVTTATAATMGVTAKKAGVARIVATAKGKADTVRAVVTSTTPPDTSPTPPDTTPPPVGGKTISPTGAASGDCRAAPCALSYALGGAGGTIRAGDTLWLRAGQYTGNQDARIQNTGNWIVFAQYPGERATLTGQLFVSGKGMEFRDFEVANLDPAREPDFIGVQIAGGPNRFIQLVSHDWTGNGFFVSWTAPNVLLSGNVIYNNGSRGSTDVSHGHGIYAQNDPGTGRKIFRDNILLNQYGYGFHLYAGTTGRLTNMTVDGNVIVNSGAVSGKAHPNILYGYGAGISGAVITDNRLYTTDNNSTTFEVGGENGQSQDAVITGNWAATGWPMFSISNVTTATVRDNRFVGIGQSGSMVSQTGSTSGWSWSGNQYWGNPSVDEWIWQAHGWTFSQWKAGSGFGASETEATGKPSGQWVTVRPSQDTPGRAVVSVYNWSNAASVTVNVPGLATGQAYEVRNAQRWWDAPLTGTYSGSITIPIQAVTPYRTTAGQQPPSTGTAFGVYVVIPR